MPHSGGHGGGSGSGGGMHLSAMAPTPSHADMHLAPSAPSVSTSAFTSMHTRDGFHRHHHHRFFRDFILPTYYYNYPKCADWAFVGVYPKDNLPPDVASFAGSITYPTSSWIDNTLYWFEQTPEGVAVYRCIANTLAAPRGGGDHFVAPFVAGDYYFPEGCTWILVGSYPKDKLPLKVAAYASGGGQGNAWIDDVLWHFKRAQQVVNVYQCTSFTGGYPVTIAAPPNKGIGATPVQPTPNPILSVGALMLGALGFLVGSTLTYVYIENKKRK